MKEKAGKCVILSAPSGAGKTTIVRYLLGEFSSLSFSISATSRPPRKGETDGDHYHFLSVDAFREKIKSGEFLEWEEVYPDRYYGTLKSEMSRIWNAGKHVIFDVDVVGGSNLKEFFGDDALAIFIKPPSLEVLEDRLRKRSTESEENLKERLSKAAQEMKYISRFDEVLINDDLKTTCQRAREMVNQFLAK